MGSQDSASSQHQAKHNPYTVHHTEQGQAHAFEELEIDKMLKYASFQTSGRSIAVCSKKERIPPHLRSVYKANRRQRTTFLPYLRIDGFIDSLGHTPKFSTVDENCNYCQVEIDHSNCDKTAFSSHYGQFGFQVCNFHYTTHWRISPCNRCNFITDKMWICPIVHRRYYLNFRRCRRTYIACSHCTVGRTERWCHIES